MRFPIAFSPVNRVFLGILGMASRWAYAEVGPDAVEIRMSYGFRGTIPRTSIKAASTVPKIPWGWGVGVHGWGGRWVVNGTLRRLVAVEIDPPARGRVLGVPVRLRQLWVSLEDPEAFLTALGR